MNKGDLTETRVKALLFLHRSSDNENASPLRFRKFCEIKITTLNSHGRVVNVYAV